MRVHPFYLTLRIYHNQSNTQAHPPQQQQVNQPNKKARNARHKESAQNVEDEEDYYLDDDYEGEEKTNRPYDPSLHPLRITNESTALQFQREKNLRKRIPRTDAERTILRDRAIKQREIRRELRDIFSQSYKERDSMKVWDLMTKCLTKDVWFWYEGIATMANHGHVKKAFKLYQSMKKDSKEPTPGTMYSLLTACVKGKDGNFIDRSFFVLSEMQKYGIAPSQHAFNLVLQACATHGNVSKSKEAFELMRTSECIPDASTFSTLISTYSKIRSPPRTLMEIWRMAKSFDLDIRAYNSLFHALKETDEPELVYKLYNEDLLNSGHNPDVHTYDIVISSCLKKNNYELAAIVCNSVLQDELRLQFDIALCNTLLKGLSRTNIHKVEKVLGLMERQHVAYDERTYETLIMVYGRQRHLKKAFELYQNIKAQHLMTLNERIFTSLIVACRQCANVRKAYDTLVEMCDMHIKPDSVFLSLLFDIIEKFGKEYRSQAIKQLRNSSFAGDEEVVRFLKESRKMRINVT